MSGSPSEGQGRFMRHPVLSTLAMIVMVEIPVLALIVLLGAPWWWAVANIAVATTLGSYVAFRVYRNPKDPGALVAFLQDPVGWFTNPD